ncbi:putative F-box protein At1g44080 [Carex rostrata]
MEKEEEEVIERNWVDLLPEHIPLIQEKLSEICDFVRFRAVCKPWHFFSPVSNLPLQFPWLLRNSRGPDLEFYSIAFNKLYTIRTHCPSIKFFFGCVGGYLLTGQANNADSFSLLNPLNNREVSLPVLHDSDIEYKFSWYNPPNFQNGDYLLIFDNEISVRCKPGDDRWDIIGPRCKGQYWPYYFKGLLFMVECRTGIIKIMDVSAHKELYVIPPPEQENMVWGYSVVPFLVESCGEILAICHSHSFGFTDFKFHIHHLEFGNGKGNPCWAKLSSIGDRILFLQINVLDRCSLGLCLRASDFAGFKGNCIYFTFTRSRFNSDNFNVVNMYDMANDETTVIDTPFGEKDDVSWFMPTLTQM